MVSSQRRTRLRPVIRVFVSSTFSDLKLERDALQQRVFPKLEQLCLNDGFQFQAIDLRWGISTEAGQDHRTIQICFEELRRSEDVSPEPNFLVRLGNRYGWRPLPETISKAEFGKFRHTFPPERATLKHEMSEVAHALRHTPRFRAINSLDREFGRRMQDSESPPISTRAPVSRPLPDYDADRAAQLNIEYQELLQEWKSLPFLIRWRYKRPESPKGI